MGLNDIKIIEGNKGSGMGMCAMAMAQEMRLIAEKMNLIKGLMGKWKHKQFKVFTQEDLGKALGGKG